MGAALGVGSLLLALTYAVTPSTAEGPPGMPIATSVNVRYLVPALIVGAGATAWSMARLDRTRPWLELAILLAVADAIRRSVAPPLSAIALAALVVAIGIALARYGPGLASQPSPRRLVVAAGAAGFCAVALAVGGYALQKRFNEIGYGGRSTVDWVLREAPSGHRIGIAGAFGTEIEPPIRALFGPRFGNQVSYVGHVEDGELRAYERRASFVAGLRRENYDLLLVGRLRIPGAPYFHRADRWTRSAGYDPVARDDRLTLYRAPRGAA
jgi:hypothetical protein